MTTYTAATGDHGTLRVDVTIGGGTKTLDFYIRSTSVVAVPTLNYSWHLGAAAPTTGTFNFLSTTLWQHIRSVIYTTETSVTLHLASSGTAQLGGPTDLVVDLTDTHSTPNGTQSGNSWTLHTGDTGTLRIDDLSDTPAKTCDLWIRSTSVVSIPNLGWGWSLNDEVPELKTFNFKSTTLWQHLGLVYVGHAGLITLHIPATGHAQLGGPTDLVVDLSGGASTLSIKVDGIWVNAKVFVRVAGVWKPSDVYIAKDGVWNKAI